MTSLRSSVNPSSSKQPWGTIIEPNFGMGYQKMTSYEVDQTVERLSQPKEKRERVYDQPKIKNLDKAGYDQMVRWHSFILVTMDISFRKTCKTNECEVPYRLSYEYT